MQKKKTKFGSDTKTVSACGIIVPVEWDTEGKPTRVAISTNDEHEYVIDKRSKQGRKMMNLLQKQVCLEGILNNRDTIMIRKYECIED